jgi:hypothetical protein
VHDLHNTLDSYTTDSESCEIFLVLLLVILYGCEAWSLASREKHRLKICENRVLRKTLKPKRNEIIGGWRILHNKQLHNLYSSPNIIRIMKSRRVRWAGHSERMGTRQIYTWFWCESQRERNHRKTNT